jgi:hypothetical protein
MGEPWSAREFFESKQGRFTAIAIVLLGIAAAGWSIWRSVRTDPSISVLESPLFIDSVTGQTFHMKLEAGMHVPVKSPYTGENTGYMAELCYWTKDGHVKSDPTPVLMQQDLGKPGPTFCPDCGRLVVYHNPMAVEGHTPPPTQEEYMASHSH